MFYTEQFVNEMTIKKKINTNNKSISTLNEYSAATRESEKMMMWFADNLEKIKLGKGKVKHIEKRINIVKGIIKDLEVQIDAYNKLSDKAKNKKEFNHRMAKSFVSGLMAGIGAAAGSSSTVVVVDATRYEDELKYYLNESKKALKYLEEEQKKLPVNEATIQKIDNVNITNIKRCIHNISVSEGRDYRDFKELEDNLNKFLPEVKCTRVLYTNNRDNLFFGMCVFPTMYGNEITHLYLTKDKLKPKLISSYALEIDSRLFDESLGLTVDEITAILLHEIGHIIINQKSLEDINTMSQMIQADSDCNIYEKINTNTLDFFRYATYLTLRRMNSIFEKNQEEYIADGIVVEYGYGKELSSAFKKIIAHRKTFVQDSNNKGIAILWALKVAVNMGQRNMSLQYQINEIEKATGSKREQEIVKNLRLCARKLGSIKESHELPDEVVLELKVLKNMKKSGLETIETDLYEFNLRIKNLDSETEALDLIRRLNYRINILKEYIQENQKDGNIQRWEEVLEQYLFLRTELMNTTIYRDKYYGLFVEIPKVNGRYQL